MKRLLFIMAIYMAAATGMSLQAENLPLPKSIAKDDTITIKLPNGAGITIAVKDPNQLKTLRSYNIDSLLSMLDKYIEQAEKMENVSSGKDNKEFTVTFYPSKDAKDAKAPEQVTLTISGATIKKAEDINKLKKVVNVIVDYDDEDENEDSVRMVKQARKNEKRSRNESFVDIGLNTFVNIPFFEGNLYDLKPLGSRYINISHFRKGQVGGSSSPLYLRGGLELAFNNFMFDNNNYLANVNGVSTFLQEPETGRNFEKSKLTYSTLNVPVDASFQFQNKKGKETFKISAGGFVGYRLGAHTKLKYQADGKTFKDKERSSYNLEDLQYGLSFSVGYRDLELFGKYNLNSLFKENRGPEMQVVSFGFRI